MTTANAAAAALDSLFGALARGDVAAAQDCFTQSGIVWHGFDRIEHGRVGMERDWTALVRNFTERFVTGVCRQPTPEGCVQQHLMIVRTAADQWIGWPVCVVVRMDGPLIARLDEYIDRAGSFTPTEQQRARQTHQAA